MLYSKSTMQILKKGWVTKKLIIFVFLSFYYLYMIYSIRNKQGIFDNEQFLTFCFNHKFLLILSFITAWSIFSIKIISRKLLLFLTACIVIYSCFIFYETNSKIVLLGTCFYGIFALFLNLLWYEELNSCMFNPNFYDNQLYKKNKYNLNVKIQQSNGDEYEGFLTNWNEYSCFIYVTNKDKIKALTGLVKITVFLLEKDFHTTGKIMTRYFNGLGILLLKDRNKNTENLNWNDFYAIIENRGILNEIKRGFL